MTHDTLVDEVRAIRDEIAREHGYNIDAIFETFRKLEDESGREHVTLPARRTAQQSIKLSGNR